jgi:hypothetical protein
MSATPTEQDMQRARELCATGHHYRGPCRLPTCPRCPAIREVIADARAEERKRCHDIIEGLLMCSDMIQSKDYCDAIFDMHAAFNKGDHEKA